MKTAKLFQNGQSQAVRLPKEFRFEGNEVFIQQQGDKVLLSPKPTSLDDFFTSSRQCTSDFMEERVDDLPQERNFF